MTRALSILLAARLRLWMTAAGLRMWVPYWTRADFPSRKRLQELCK